MKNFIAWSGFAVAIVSAVTQSSPAQGPPAPPVFPMNRPVISPYLNLLRQGSSPANNYFNLVRPQIDFNNSINQLQRQTAANRSAIAGIEQSTNQFGDSMRPTGFVPQFLNQNSYFLTYAGGGAMNQNTVPNRGNGGRVGVTLPRAMGVPSLGVPAMGAPAMGTPRFR